MNQLFLCGITDSGKSTTIKNAVIHYLPVTQRIKNSYINNQNPTKYFRILGKLVVVWLCSPQELENTPNEARNNLKKKIESAEKRDAKLFIISFNIDQEEKTDECLKYLSNVKKIVNSWFVYLPPHYNLSKITHRKMSDIKNKGFNLLPTINQKSIMDRARIFSSYIMDFIK